MRAWASKWIGWVRVVALLGVFFGLIVRIGDPLPLSVLRNVSLDFFHQSYPREYTPLPVAIIDVDDRSLSEIGQWPWPRTRIAEIVQKSTLAGAAAIAFDIVFSEPDRLSPGAVAMDNPRLPPDVVEQLKSMPDNDIVLAEAIARSRVVLGQASVRTIEGNRSTKIEMADVPHAFVGGDPTPFLPQFPDVVQNLPILEANAAGYGVFSARPDVDGVYRSAPLVISVQGKVRLGLSAELLRIATGGGPFLVRTNEAGIEGVVIARQLIETAQDGSVWPHLTPSNRARYVSATDLLNDRMPQGRLAGHLVFVGTSAIGLEDFRPTMLGVSMAGVEIHAQVLENIISQTMLKRPNYMIAIELVVTLFLCVLVILFVPVMAARWVISLSLALLGVYVSVSYYFFTQRGVVLDPSYPVISTFLTFALMTTVNYLREERLRRSIRNAFGQYVSPDLVGQLSDHPEDLKLGGETRELTLLFSDVRGFTAIAEDYKDDPEALTRLMNQFLTLVSQAIMDNGGTIDKFMGDAVMAFWNAPTNNPDHPRAACNAALRIMADIHAFNERSAYAEGAGIEGGARAREHHKINIGVGINSGMCVVGNMGSETRFDYTALGDPVNVASRLEGQSRYYGVQVILGMNTVKIVGDEFAILKLDTVMVLGKHLPETIFALLGDKSMRDEAGFQEIFSLNEQMHEAYDAQEWDKALQKLDLMQSINEHLELSLAVYLDLFRNRISELRSDPPGEDWDGVYKFTKKSS
ncbi:CHASE2 domain-containing protein [Shimia sp. W99]